MNSSSAPNSKTSQPRTILDKIWQAHVIPCPALDGSGPDGLAIDLHLVHEVTSPQAFATLRERGLPLRRPTLTLATMDHSTPTSDPDGEGKYQIDDPAAARQLDQLRRNCRDFGVPLLPLGHPDRGIVHVIGPELGLTQPGMTIVCGDSHTSTHGAFGALAFGIGSFQVAQVFACQCLLGQQPESFEVRVDGHLQPGVTAKDVILAVIAEIGTDGGTGHVFEFTGSTIRTMSMEQRLTVCNMAIEGGARAGLIAPDDTTFSYLRKRRFAPRGTAWETALAEWRLLASDPGARYARSVGLDAGRIEPQVTWGTSPGTAIAISAPVPEATQSPEKEALQYMGFTPGRPLRDHPVDVVFIGSCTNSRISDLRDAASVLRHRGVSPKVRAVVVPGSEEVKRQAEAEGLDRVFVTSGAEWRQPGCSMCLAMNGDRVAPGQLAVSTSNRNFEGRQGPRSRTVLASPLTAAASAVNGRISDPREMQ